MPSPEEVIQNYNYEYGDYDAQSDRQEEEDVPRTSIEWFDARSRQRRETKQSAESQENVKYTVCVRSVDTQMWEINIIP